jgi:hypothetical protein
MGPTPYRPVRELEGAIERGELDFALAYARELMQENKRPLDLELALGLLGLIALQRPQAYDAWALRWLGRWMREARRPTIETAARIATALAALPKAPQQALARIRAIWQAR